MLAASGCASPSAQNTPAPAPKPAVLGVTSERADGHHLDEPQPQIKVPANIPLEQQGRWILQHARAGREAQMQSAMVANVPQMIGVMKSLEKAGQFDQILIVAAHNAPLAPRNGQIPYLEGRAHFFNGNFVQASASWGRALGLDPSLQSQVAPLQAQMARIRRAYPGLQLKPVAVVPSDAGQHAAALWKRALSLRKARRYDDIERACDELQKSGGTAMDGRSDASVFCADLSEIDVPDTSFMHAAQAKQVAEAAWEKTRADLEEWVRARPDSKWARLTLFRAWVDRAWDVRGGDYADKISPDQWDKVHLALSQSADVASRLPASVKDTPFFWQTTLSFSQLVGVPFEQFAAQYEEGARRFPKERTLDFRMATMLLPQWSGQMGAWQDWIGKRADAIGGVEGDIAYGQLVLHMNDSFEDAKFWAQPGLDWPRARRGFQALLGRHPDSVAIATWLLLNARRNHDQATARAMIVRLNNRANAAKWLTPAEFARLRLDVLDPASRS